jgi:hypothetical protein
MKNLLGLAFGIVIFLMVFPLVLAYACDDITEQSEIPCEVITPKLNCSSNANVTYTYNASFNYTATMSKIDAACSSSCKYNFSFNYTKLGSYEIEVCDGSYAVINIVEERTETNWVARGTETIIKKEPLNIDYVDKFFENSFNLGKDIFLKYYWFLIPLGIFLLIFFRKKKLKKVLLKEKRK